MTDVLNIQCGWCLGNVLGGGRLGVHFNQICRLLKVFFSIHSSMCFLLRLAIFLIIWRFFALLNTLSSARSIHLNEFYFPASSGAFYFDLFVCWHDFLLITIIILHTIAGIHTFSAYSAQTHFDFFPIFFQTMPFQDSRVWGKIRIYLNRFYTIHSAKKREKKQNKKGKRNA